MFNNNKNNKNLPTAIYKIDIIIIIIYQHKKKQE